MVNKEHFITLHSPCKGKGDLQDEHSRRMGKNRFVSVQPRQSTQRLRNHSPHYPFVHCL